MTGYERLVKDFEGKKILVLGLGMLGRGVGDAIFFASIGCELRITDLKSEDQLKESMSKLSSLKAEFILGEHREQDIEWADVILRNAAVPWDSSFLELARAKNKEIVMDTQLFVKYAKDLEIIGVTGTRGKTTTTKLIANILRHSTDKQIILGGNVRGVATLPQIKTIKDAKNTIAVLELSSWQLQAFELHKQGMKVAVITNIYPDHLNTYPDMASYENDKKSIFRHQTSEDVLIFNGQQPQLNDWSQGIEARVVKFNIDDLPASFNWSLVGGHNLENAAAAYQVSKVFNVSDQDFVEAASTFKPIQYRLEYVGNVGGAEVYNDSNSTTPIATIKALSSFSDKVVLIAGGEDKNLPIEEMVSVINEKAKKVIFLSGSGTNRIKPNIQSDLVVGEYDEFETGVSAAIDHLSDEDVLLFSPGFTSFGMFNNEYERGDAFQELVDRRMG